MHTSHSQSRNNDDLLISYLTLRRAVGCLGISLPLVLVLGSLFRQVKGLSSDCATIGSCNQLQESISHYYYSPMGDVFVGAICSISLFLLCYTGYDIKDRISSAIAGLAALGVAFFPTDNPSLVDENCHCVVRTTVGVGSTVNTHYSFAALFFLSLAYISYYRFTKTEEKGKETKRKLLRNEVYRACGIVIIVAIALILIYSKLLTLDVKEQLRAYRPVFWLEWVSLFAFGFSWLVKGETLLKD